VTASPAPETRSRRACPSCGEGMRVEVYERKGEGRLELDILMDH
jgi:hypothetical protein